MLEPVFTGLRAVRFYDALDEKVRNKYVADMWVVFNGEYWGWYDNDIDVSNVAIDYNKPLRILHVTLKITNFVNEMYTITDETERFL